MGALPGRSSTIEVITVGDDAVLIKDRCAPGNVSVTNNAENVCNAVYWHLGPKRILYIDTDGRMDELVTDGKGHFVDFAPPREEEVW